MYVNLQNRFELDEYTQDHLHSLIPPFGYNGFGEFIFYRTYSRVKDDGGQEDWADVVIRFTEGAFTIRKDWYRKNHIHWDEDFWQNYARDFAISGFKMEWLPPGRGLWAMGTNFVYERGSAALQNCFSGLTKFVTDKGIFALRDCVNEEINVLTSDGKFRKATVKSFGKQKLRRIRFKPFDKRKSNYYIDIKATRNHRWILNNNIETTYLKVGDVIKSSKTIEFEKNNKEYINGFTHGFIFGDGHQNTKYPNRFVTRLCGKKVSHKELIQKSDYYKLINYQPSCNGDPIITCITDINLKEPPLEITSYQYKRAFFLGWLAADGYGSDNMRLDTTNVKGVNWLRDHNIILGFKIKGHSLTNNDTNFGKRNFPLHRFQLDDETDTAFKVVSILDYETSEEEVFCVVEPVTKTFTLANGILTGNCGYIDLKINLSEEISWLMDMLMLGVGVGFSPVRNDKMELYLPKGSFDYIIPDTREGWCKATELKIQAYTKPGQKKPNLIYDKIRPNGLPIKGFGGISSGPEPLIKFHKDIEKEVELFKSRKEYDSVYFKTNLANRAGCCIIAGNVRRTAELAKCSLTDPVFSDLKDYDKFPEREEFGGMSNNTVDLESDEDFQSLGEIAKRVTVRGEPGYSNLRNFPYARLGKKMHGLRKDKARGLNPCGEQLLESYELCTLAETMPTVCKDPDIWLKVCEFATLYASTVTLLSTHQPKTNKVMCRNRRIGISIIDWTGWKHDNGMHKVIKWMREGYKTIRSINNWTNDEAGIPRAIRVTTIKPGGTTPKLPGKTSGCGHPTFDYTIRRVRVGKSTPVHELLVEAGIPYEVDYFDKYTDVFEYPILQGPARPAEFVTIWEQAFNLVTLDCGA